jgi:phosphonate degradation associated HDIG domain protein
MIAIEKRPRRLIRRDIVREIAQLLTRHGGDAYFGEEVTQLQHALQCAYLAVQHDADESLVAAALLHDIGHLLPKTDASQEDHERQGACWLQPYFPLSVTEPISLHVPAKRYLCATVPDYLIGLSRASLESLNRQGGPMSNNEVRTFERHPYYRAALLMRRWDDAAKTPRLSVPPLVTYLPLLKNLSRKHRAD